MKQNDKENIENLEKSFEILNQLAEKSQLKKKNSEEMIDKLQEEIVKLNEGFQKAE